MGPHRSALTITIAATVLAWAAWGLTIAFVDPNASGWLGTLMFSSTLFAAVGGSATVLGLFARRRAEDRARAIRIAIRQGALTALAVAIGVFLQTKDLLTWWNLLFLIAALTLLELFIVSLRHESPGASRDRELVA